MKPDEEQGGGSGNPKKFTWHDKLRADRNEECESLGVRVDRPVKRKLKGIAKMNAQHPPRWIGERPEGWR